MADKIIWKVICLVGGIIGATISIVKIVELNKEYYYYYDIEFLYKLPDIESAGNMWGMILFISIIIFIIGCNISTNKK